MNVFCAPQDIVWYSDSLSLSQLHHPQICAEPAPNPFDALLLWVGDEWPTLTGGQDGSVLNWHPNSWQTLVTPGSNGGFICKHEDWIQAVCQGDRDLEQKQRGVATLAGEFIDLLSQQML